MVSKRKKSNGLEKENWNDFEKISRMASKWKKKKRFRKETRSKMVSKIKKSLERFRKEKKDMEWLQKRNGMVSKNEMELFRKKWNGFEKRNGMVSKKRTGMVSKMKTVEFEKKKPL